MGILLKSNLKCVQLYWITVGFCLKPVIIAITTSQTGSGADSTHLCALPGPGYSWCWHILRLFSTSAGLWDALLLWREHSRSTAAMWNFAVPSCSPILEAVTQLPLKNPPSRTLGVTFIVYTGWSSWRNSSLLCRLTIPTGDLRSSLCSCNLYHTFCHLSHRMPSTQSAKSNLSWATKYLLVSRASCSKINGSNLSSYLLLIGYLNSLEFLPLYLGHHLHIIFNFPITVLSAIRK